MSSVTPMDGGGEACRFLRSELRQQAFDPWQCVAAWEHELRLASLGAAAVFVGRMRDENAGRAVAGMFLEHYPGMTERRLAEICREVADAFRLRGLAVAHRCGEVVPGETLVVVAAWSGHRNAAQRAAAELLERVKHEVPLWKRERLVSGDYAWVERNSDGSGD